MNFCSSPFGMAPTTLSTSLPSLNIMSVGMDVTPYYEGKDPVRLDA